VSDCGDASTGLGWSPVKFGLWRTEQYLRLP